MLHRWTGKNRKTKELPAKTKRHNNKKWGISSEEQRRRGVIDPTLAAYDGQSVPHSFWTCLNNNNNNPRFFRWWTPRLSLGGPTRFDNRKRNVFVVRKMWYVKADRIMFRWLGIIDTRLYHPFEKRRNFFKFVRVVIEASSSAVGHVSSKSYTFNQKLFNRMWYLQEVIHKTRTVLIFTNRHRCLKFGF